MRAPLARALAKWQEAAGPYWLYVGPAPFVGPGHAPRKPLPAAQPDLLDAIAGCGRAMVFLDLAPELTLPAAPALSARGFVVVPAFQRWSAEPAGRRLRQMLVAAAPDGPAAAPRGVVFLLDGTRDYWYPECRFPPPRLLRAEGIDEVVLVPRIAPDLEPYAATLAEAGIRARAA